MASSSLSGRRGPLRRPKVCTASPNPGRCHPPPPPPPEEWPPDEFDVHFQYWWLMIPDIGFVQWDLTVIRQQPDWIWAVGGPPPESATVWFSPEPPSPNMRLHIQGTAIEMFPYDAKAYPILIQTGVPTQYDITTWAELSGDIFTVEANFFF